MSIPRTLTHDEEKRILKVTEKGCFRDHVIILLALKTALRSHEICALTVGDVYDGPTVRRALQLRVFKGDAAGKRQDQMVWLSNEVLRDRLARFYQEKQRAGQDMSPTAPLFVSRGGGRKSNRSTAGISGKRLLDMFHKWQAAAGVDRLHRFHDLRHTAATRWYQQTKDVDSVQAFGRWLDPAAAKVYRHVDDEYQERIARFL